MVGCFQVFETGWRDTIFRQDFQEDIHLDEEEILQKKIYFFNQTDPGVDLLRKVASREFY